VTGKAMKKSRSIGVDISLSRALSLSFLSLFQGLFFGRQKPIKKPTGLGESQRGGSRANVGGTPLFKAPLPERPRSMLQSSLRRRRKKFGERERAGAL